VGGVLQYEQRHHDNVQRDAAIGNHRRRTRGPIEKTAHEVMKMRHVLLSERRSAMTNRRSLVRLTSAMGCRDIDTEVEIYCWMTPRRMAM